MTALAPIPLRAGRALRVCSICAEWIATAGLAKGYAGPGGAYWSKRVHTCLGEETAFVTLTDHTDPTVGTATERCGTCARLGPQRLWDAFWEDAP